MRPPFIFHFPVIYYLCIFLIHPEQFLIPMIKSVNRMDNTVDSKNKLYPFSVYLN